MFTCSKKQQKLITFSTLFTFMVANKIRQLINYLDSTQSKLDSYEFNSISNSTRNINESSRATRNSTQKLTRNSNIFVYKILKVFLKFYISIIGDDINNISLFFLFLNNHIFLLFI